MIDPANRRGHTHVSLSDLAAGGGRWLMLLGLTARVPAAMLPMSLLLGLVASNGGFAVAGGCVALVGLFGAVTGPVFGALADRVGHRLVVLLVSGAQAGALVGLTLNLRGPVGLLLTLSALVGACNPAIGSMARSLWTGRSRSRAGRAPFMSTAMGWEAAADEVSFVIGPVVASLLTSVAGSVVCLLPVTAFAFLAQGGFALLAGVPIDPVGSLRDTRRAGSIALRCLPAAVAVLAVGVVFGATQGAIAARLESSGRTELTGLVYGCLGVGSAVSGLAVTRLPAKVPPSTRLLGFGATLAVTAVLLLAATSPITQAAACLIVGLSVLPILATSYLWTERIVPPSAATLAMAALSTLTAVGVGVGVATAGQLVDAGLVWVALALPAVAGVMVLLSGLSARGMVRRHRAFAEHDQPWVLVPSSTRPDTATERGNDGGADAQSTSQ